MGTLTIVLRGGSVRPDARLSVRSGLDGWQTDVPCEYVRGADEWRVELQGEGPVEFKFRCDGAWERGPNRVVDGEHVATMKGRVADLFEQPDDIPVADSLAARVHFPPVSAEEVFDYIVVGSGTGGGTLAHRLMVDSEGEARVLVLEAGGYLFPTHVGNLPRRHGPYVNRSVWELWNQFKVRRYDTDQPMDLAQAFCLGGRSLFWGALVPRMAAAEFAGWPEPIRQDLESTWYARAEDLLNGTAMPQDTLCGAVQSLLKGHLPDLADDDAMLAAEHASVNGLGIPSGIFSTAALLMEDVLRAAWADRLHVNLHHQVCGFVFDGDAVTAVEAFDLAAGVPRTYRLAEGGSVIMAGGTVGTPVLAHSAGLEHELIGRGITDHPTYYWKFSVKDGAPGYSARDAAKLLLRGTAGGTPFNAVVEMGVNLNQYHVDEDLDLDEADMPCEVVFFTAVPLEERNSVEVRGEGRSARPRVVMHHVEVPGLEEVMAEVGAAVMAAVGGTPLDPRPMRSTLGAVGHEVGTMRIGADAATGVVDPDLKVYGRRNLYVCDLSVFPTSPAANPSLTLAALAMRLSDRLVNG
ncbi:GMC oxidoreductase [Nonomuraea sp. NPDC049152]|uniref:GMC oxidoreductase n=1 Tax=Nonomuraea sp. NPDC049152 TaxID=3154350 RepID=UPI0033CE2FE9